MLEMTLIAILSFVDSIVLVHRISRKIFFLEDQFWLTAYIYVNDVKRVEEVL